MTDEQKNIKRLLREYGNACFHDSRDEADEIEQEILTALESPSTPPVVGEMPEWVGINIQYAREHLADEAETKKTRTLCHALTIVADRLAAFTAPEQEG